MQYAWASFESRGSNNIDYVCFGLYIFEFLLSFLLELRILRPPSWRHEKLSSESKLSPGVLDLHSKDGG